MLRFAMFAWMLIASVQTASAQSSPSTASACGGSPHTDVAFWVGDWNVSDTRSDVPIAESRIEWIVGGCAIRETFLQTVGPGGKPYEYEGSSITSYSPRDKQWHQQYSGSDGSSMIFSGDADGRALTLIQMLSESKLTRMTIAAQDDGSVRQTGESSTDNGKSWTTGYDFTYRRKPGEQGADAALPQRVGS